MIKPFVRRERRVADSEAKGFGSPGLPQIYIVLAVLGLANMLLLLPSGLYGRLIGSVVLFCFLPGILLVSLAFSGAAEGDGALSLLEGALLGAAASYLLTTMLLLLLGYLGVPIYAHVVVGVLDALVLFLLYLNRGRGFGFRPATRGVRERDRLKAAGFALLLLISLLALALRAGNLGYAEYLGDEAEVVYRARQVVLGNEEELYLQRKGPTQIMMAAAFILGTNGFNEAALRAPFALASFLAVVATYLLGRSIWNTRVGIAAAALLAIDGIVVGFTRIVQYQGVVLLVSVLILYSLHRMLVAEESAVGGRFLGAALVLFGFALLTHYETALIGVPLAMICWAHRGRCLSDGYRGALVVGAGIAVALLLVFYVPFVLHPHFAETVDVYTQRRIGYGRGGPFDNVGRYAASSIFYNSLYYVVATALLMALGTMRILRAALTGIPRWAACLAVPGAVAGVVLSLASPLSLISGNMSYAFLLFVPVTLLALLAASGRPPVASAVLAWLLVSFMAYAFFIRVPGLHYYTLAPAAALVAAAGLDWIGRAVDVRAPRPLRRLTWGVAAALYIVMVAYVYLVFVRPEPAYAVDFPEHRMGLYWTPQTEIPDGGFFGFPRRSGWKALGVLYHQGELRGTHLSNKKQVKPEWTYMRNAEKAEVNLRYFFFDEISARLTSNESYPLDWVEENFELIGQVRVHGQPRIHIYQRPEDVRSTELRVYDIEDYEPLYERIDWLAEYRHAAENGLREEDVAALRRYLEQAPRPDSVLLLNDALLERALNYYYAGPAQIHVMPREWDGSAAEAWFAGASQVCFVRWADVNGSGAQAARRWLEQRYAPVDETSFGSLRVVRFTAATPESRE